MVVGQQLHRFKRSAGRNDAQFYTNSGTLILSPDCSGPVGFFAGCRASTGYGSGTTLGSRGAAGAWHHYVIEFNMGATLAVVAAYLDGVSVSLGSEGLTGSQGGGDFAANILNIGATTAVPAISSRAESLNLPSGKDRCSAVRTPPPSITEPLSRPPSSRPITGRSRGASPEPATVGSVALNVHGTTQVADPTTGTYTLTGPTSGTIGVASTNFTVTPSASYTGTITITPVRRRTLDADHLDVVVIVFAADIHAYTDDRGHDHIDPDEQRESHQSIGGHLLGQPCPRNKFHAHRPVIGNRRRCIHQLHRHPERRLHRHSHDYTVRRRTLDTDHPDLVRVVDGPDLHHHAHVGRR